MTPDDAELAASLRGMAALRRRTESETSPSAALFDLAAERLTALSAAGERDRSFVVRDKSGFMETFDATILGVAAGERDTTEAGEGWTFEVEHFDGEEPSGRYEHWTWELLDPADDVYLEGTDTSDPSDRLEALARAAGLAARPAPVTGKGEPPPPHRSEADDPEAAYYEALAADPLEDLHRSLEELDAPAEPWACKNCGDNRWVSVSQLFAAEGGRAGVCARCGTAHDLPAPAAPDPETAP